MPEEEVIDALDVLRAELNQLGNLIRDSEHRLFHLKESLSNPNLHGLPINLSFKVQQWDRWNKHIRLTVSANANITIARAAFDAAVKNYPDYRWTLSQGMMLMGKHEPKPEEPK